MPKKMSTEENITKIDLQIEKYQQKISELKKEKIKCEKEQEKETAKSIIEIMKEFNISTEQIRDFAAQRSALNC